MRHLCKLAGQLTTGEQAVELSERTIGFDLRVARAPDDPWFPDYLLRKNLETIVSVDPFVFPIPLDEVLRRENEKTEPHVNPSGVLMDLPQAKPHEWAIAMTIAPDIVRALLQKFGVPLLTSSLSTASELATNGWVWLGYDVADIGKLISGLMNCGPSTPELVTAFSSHINQYGLFKDLKSAQAFGRVRDAQIPQHSPFNPVSIWRKL